MRKSSPALVAGAVVLCTAWIPAVADNHIVMQRSNLRSEPDRNARLVETLVIGRAVTVEPGNPKNGYVKVATLKTDKLPANQGWVLAKNLEEEIVVAGLESDEAGAHAGTSIAEGCDRKYSDYSECPDTGCGTTDAKKLFDSLKNTTTVAGHSQPLTFADFHALEDAVEEKNFRGGSELSRIARDGLLHSISLPSGATVSEGDTVSFAGYISAARTISCGSQESCNCEFKNSKNDAPCTHTDIHIPLVESASLPEEDSVVVELTPRVGHLDSLRDAQSLGTIQTAGQQVLVVGRLFFDNAHLPNPTGSAGSQPKRFTIWEVHPITKFYVCPSGKTCDPNSISEWEERSH